MALKATHRTAAAITATGVALIIAGGALIAGPLVLLGTGVALVVVGLFVLDDAGRRP